MPLGFPPAEPHTTGFRLQPVDFSDLPGWTDDRHAEAYRAFLKSCAPILADAEKTTSKTDTSPGDGTNKDYRAALLALCRNRVASGLSDLSAADARLFFEQNFVPHRVEHQGPEGLLTGYYEPVLPGARAPNERFHVPIFHRPPDLENMVTEAERGAVGSRFTHMRRTEHGLEPYPTRAEIERGALTGQDLAFMWLEDEVDTFFMHIQGSGRIRLPDGSQVRVTYDGKNGHPYTSIGRYLIDSGLFPADQMSLDALKDWLKQNPERGREAMWQNKSFVFFRELAGRDAESPMGVMHIPLTEGRSLAVDTAFHVIGTPVFVVSPTITHAEEAPSPSAEGFRRLMIAQDVGSAIRGPERGDLYFGSGDDAGKRAGITKHPGRFFVLVPRNQT